MQEKELNKTPGKTFHQIWSEGYSEEGAIVFAELLDTVEAETFDDAVAQYIKDVSNIWPDVHKVYQRKERYMDHRHEVVHTMNNCRLFDNEADARKSHG